jgi:hypothetical protein
MKVSPRKNRGIPSFPALFDGCPSLITAPEKKSGNPKDAIKRKHAKGKMITIIA